MYSFSPDGLWWWDGKAWSATFQIAPFVPQTEFERSGRLADARRLMTLRQSIFVGFYVVGLSVVGVVLLPPMLVWFMYVQHRAFKAYREWSIEILALATAELLGKEEPMVAGETTCWTPSGFWPGMERDFAVAVTARHVVMYRFLYEDSGAVQVLFAADPSHVELASFEGVFKFSLSMTSGGRRWWLPGLRGISQARDVVARWRSVRDSAVPAAAAS